MKKKSLAIILTLIMLLTSLVSCGGDDSNGETGDTTGGDVKTGETGDLDPFEISMITQLTGPNAFGGHEYQYGAELALEHRGGAINGREIKLTFADGPTADATVAEFERLYNDGSRVFVSGYGCIADRTFATMCDEMEVLYLSLAWDADLIQGPSDYFYRVGANVTDFAKGVADASANIGEQYLNIKPADLKVALIYVERLKHLADPMMETFEELGVDVVIAEGYPTDTKDFATLVTKLMNTEYDILVPIQGAADGTPFQKKMNEMKHHPKLTLGAGIYYDTPVFADLGDDITDGILSLSFTTPSISEKAAPGVTKFKEDYKEKYGHYPLAHALQAYGAMQVYFSVMETMDPADWDDTAKFAETMKNFKKPEGELVWYWGVDYDELNSNTLANQFIVNQWSGGELNCIFPDFLATAEAKIPWEK